MTTEGSDTTPELSASLARLRQFLKPHASLSRPEDKTHHDQVETNHEVDGQHATEHPPRSDDPAFSDEMRDDDLSVLAEHMATTEAITNECETSEQLDTAIPPPPPPPSPPQSPSTIASMATDDAQHCREPDYEHPVVPTHDPHSHVSAEPETAMPALGTVATVSPIHASTKDFARVKYLLQCSLPGFRVHDDVVIWDMKNPALVAQYEQHTQGLLELDSWVGVDELSAAMDDHTTTTMDTPPTSHPVVQAFTTGVIPMPDGCKKGRKQLVLCKIAVGRSLVIEKDADSRTMPLPSGYHSYYLRRPSIATEDATASLYAHEYILNSTVQILPQFLVRFSFSAVDVKTASACALCEKQSAVVACKACDAELCGVCDQDVHSANKLVSRHKRTPVRAKGARGANHTRTRRRSSTPSVNEQLNVEPTESTVEMQSMIAKQLEDGLVDFQAGCRVHDGKKVEFYCPICEVPVCVNCKMIGDHSSGEKGAHRLLSIADAYERSLRESIKSDPLVESRRTVIENKLQLIDQWRHEVATNRAQVEAAIRQQYQQALDRLDEEVKKKMGVLDGEAFEYVRQLEQIEWLEDCLDDQRVACGVLDFLSTWSQHKLLRAEQRDFPTVAHVSMGEHVKADLQLIGRLQVVAGDHFEARKSWRSGTTAIAPEDEPTTAAILTQNETVSAYPPSIRRTSDSEIRRKLLSMKTQNSDGSGPVVPVASPTTLSAKGMKMMEEIRKELLAKPSIGTTALRTPTSTSVMSNWSTLSIANPTATLRGFSMQPIVRKKSLNGDPTSYDNSGIPSASPRRQRLGTDAWSTLLRQEMGLRSDQH